MSASEIGLRVQQQLVSIGLETPRNLAHMTFSKETMHSEIAEAHHSIMQMLGLDMLDASLRDTPKRVAKMYCQEIFTGLNYENFPDCTVVPNTFGLDEMVAVKATVNSMCEHHFMPFVGTAYIAYIPGQKILGLSKFNRVTDFFSRRPQIQERLTAQIFYALSEILETGDIAVVIKARHMCVEFRGIKDRNSLTSTSFMGGRFRSNQPLREEFLLTVQP